jgi:hypothetical protein
MAGPFVERDLSRFEALVRKRESLLKSIYERRKGEGWLLPWGKLCLLSLRSPMFYPKKNNKNITRASKNNILATAHASFGNPFVFTAANFVPKEARGSDIETAPVFSQRGKLARFVVRSSLLRRETMPALSSYGFLLPLPLARRKEGGQLSMASSPIPLSLS